MPRGTGAFLDTKIFLTRGQGIRIIGIDPGVRITGFGVIERGPKGSILYCGSGVVQPRPNQPFPQRIQQIFQGLCQQIEHFAPGIMAVERPFFAKNVKSAMLLGQARGVAILAAAEAMMDVQEFSPLEVKQAIVGYGRATKEQVQAMIRALLKIRENLTADAADALAVALCLAHSFSWQKVLSSAENHRSFSQKAGTVRANIINHEDIR